jgi:hypothetical protein
LNGQDISFNKRFHLGFNQLAFRSIEVSDSSFFVSGLGTDQWYGSVFAEFDFLGESIFSNYIFSPEEYILAYGKDLHKISFDKWIVSGEGVDSVGGYVLVLKLNDQGEIEDKVKIFHPDFPQEEFISDAGGIEKIPGGWIGIFNIESFLVDPPSVDLFAVKLNNDFSINWAKKYASPPMNESARSVAYKSGKILIGAYKTNFNTTNKNFNTQLYILQIDTLNGSVTKSFLYPSVPTNQLLMGPADDMVVEEDGSVIVATRVGKEEPINPVSSFIRWSTAILKVNANLTQVVWEQTMFSGNSNDATQFHKIVKALDGSGYIAAGSATYEPGTFGGALAKVSPDGDSLWLRHYKYVTTKPSFHYIYDLEPTPDGGYVMVGEARPYNGYDTLYPPPIQQGWILKVDEWGCLAPGCQLDVGVEEPPAPVATLKVYPNPASGEFYVHLPEAGPGGRFRLYDALGREALSFAATGGEATYIVSLEGVAPGWYALVYEEEGGKGRRWMARVVVR